MRSAGNLTVLGRSPDSCKIAGEWGFHYQCVGLIDEGSVDILAGIKREYEVSIDAMDLDQGNPGNLRQFDSNTAWIPVKLRVTIAACLE